MACKDTADAFATKIRNNVHLIVVLGLHIIHMGFIKLDNDLINTWTLHGDNWKDVHVIP